MKKLLTIKKLSRPNCFCKLSQWTGIEIFFTRLESIGNYSENCLCYWSSKTNTKQKSYSRSKVHQPKKKVAGPSQGAKPSQKPYGKNFKFLISFLILL
jgi:hypothetical protein